MRDKQIGFAIFIGFALVALAIILPKFFTVASIPTQKSSSLERKPEERHLYGQKNAPTKIVEFSDLECPFCAQLHITLKELVDDSGGQIVWEYRHLPLTSHPHSFEAALASECVAEVKGESEFFNYLDKIFSKLGDLDSVDITKLALESGVSKEQLEKCFSDPTLKARVEDDLNTASQKGAKGTPFSVIINKTGETRVVPGALSKVQWESLLELTK